jgi:hypothetical protein
MIEQQAVLWLLTIYQPPTLAVFYVSVLSSPTAVWYNHHSRSCPSRIAIYTFFSFFRLARGSILASVIRIMPGGRLRVVALYLSGSFIVLYLVVVFQFVWVCETGVERDVTGYVPCGIHFRIVSVSRYYERFSSSLPQCVYKPQVAILQMTGDSDIHSRHFILLKEYKVAMISDALLIFLPLRTLRHLKNQPRLRRRLQIIFAASALTTCASIITGVFIWLNIGFGYFIVVETEVLHPFSAPLRICLLFQLGRTILLTSSFTLPTM